jgi:hypothetical protein
MEGHWEARYSRNDFETHRRLTLKDQGRHYEQSTSDVATVSESFEALAKIERRSVQVRLDRSYEGPGPFRRELCKKFEMCMVSGSQEQRTSFED